MAKVALAAQQASVTVGERAIVDSVDVEIFYGEVTALVGPNGAGKSTLLSLFSGDRRPSAGYIWLDGRPVSSWQPRVLARKRSMLAQENSVAFSFKVGEIVAMGRSPWQGTPAALDDPDIVLQALAEVDALHLQHRIFNTLSGGEKARVSLARVLAQQAQIVLLDEPTAALDLGHQEDVMQIAQRLAAQGNAVVVVVHDLSLAAAHANRIVLLQDGKARATGAPADVITADTIADVYGVKVGILEHPQSQSPIVVPLR